jgi:hypothetical protein
MPLLTRAGLLVSEVHQELPAFSSRLRQADKDTLVTLVVWSMV